MAVYAILRAARTICFKDSMKDFSSVVMMVVFIDLYNFTSFRCKDTTFLWFFLIYMQKLKKESIKNHTASMNIIKSIIQHNILSIIIQLFYSLSLSKIIIIIRIPTRHAIVVVVATIPIFAWGPVAWTACAMTAVFTHTAEILCIKIALRATK